MIEILIKASFAIAAGLIFYKLVLQQESFFGINRLYLLCCIIFAFSLPFINLPQVIDQQGFLEVAFEAETEEKEQPAALETAEIPAPLPNEGDTFLPEVEPSEIPQTSPASEATQPSESSPVLPGSSFEKAETLDLLKWLTILYFFGVGIFSLSFLFQLGSIGWTILTATDRISDGECTIVSTPGKQAPCSFFRYVFIHPDDYELSTYRQILAHEKTHVRMGHSLDLLLAELTVILLWFNPIVWLLKKEIEKNNEYQTDDALLESGEVPKEKYQLNLLQIAVPHKPLNITTNYNQSLIKQRIMMMNSRRSTAHAYWKYTFMVPLFLGMLLIFNEPAASQEKEKENQVSKKQEERSSSERLYRARATEARDSAVQQRLEQREKIREQREELVEDRETLRSEREESVRYRVQTREREALSRQAMVAERSRQAQTRRTERENSVLRRNISGSNRGVQSDMTQGKWQSTRKDGETCIRFSGGDEHRGWNMSECFASGAFEKVEDGLFTITRETGTLELKGDLDAEGGHGSYTFTENTAFRDYLSESGTASDQQNLMFHLFLGDIGKDYVEFLKENYETISSRRLLELAIHGVTKQRFQNYVALFQKYNNRNPGIQEVVEAQIHGIDEGYVQELQEAGYEDLSLEQMMKARIHGVTSSYVKSLQNAGFDDLSINEVITAKIHGIDPETIRETRSLGLGKLDLDKIVELQIHGVDAAYMKELQSIGLGDLTLDQVITARIHGLDPASVKEIRALGIKDPDFSDLITARIHGLNQNFVQDLKKAGFGNLEMDELVAAKIHGINRGFIEESRKAGYDLETLDQYISLKIHGSALESLKNGDDH